MIPEIRLSASAINDFLACGRMYWYRRFQPQESVENIDLLVGKVVHEALEKHWNDQELALNFIDKNLESGFQKARNSVNGFFTHYSKLVDMGDLIEKFFNIDYPKIKGVKLVGKFDRICIPNIIYDWKTSKSHPKTLSNSPQFILYYYAYTNLYRQEPNLYYAALDGKLIKYNHDYKLSELFFNELIPTIVDSIRSGNFTPSGLYKYNTCYRCIYKIHCHDTLLGKEYNL